MNIEEAQQAVAVLQAAFPSPRLPSSTVTMWAAGLVGEGDESNTLEDAQVAATRLSLSSKRMPSLAEFVQEIREARFRRQEPSTSLQLPGETPAQLLEAMRNGRGPSDDPV